MHQFCLYSIWELLVKAYWLEITMTAEFSLQCLEILLEMCKFAEGRIKFKLFKLLQCNPLHLPSLANFSLR